NFAYYSSTTAGDSTAGGVTGYIQQISLQQGQNGPAVLQKTWQYFLHTANGLSVSPVASDSVYRNIDGTGEEKTTYGYSWFTIPGTIQVQSQTVTLPTIPTTENGPGTPDIETTFFDSDGRPIWHKDGGSFLTYTAYDTATGAVVKSIDDVNTSQ